MDRMTDPRPPAIEGIGHVLCLRLRREIEEAANFVARDFGRELGELLIVRAVHGEQEIEAGVIGARDLPRALAGDVDAAPSRRTLRARVRCLADMPIAETGRVDVEEKAHALILGDAAENAFGHGRAADIAKTNEEEPMLS